MKPDPSHSPERETGGASARRDPQRIERPGTSDGWPSQWAWEEDNLADGLGVGPFPAGRKPPKRAERFRDFSLTPPDEDDPASDD
jgi:hypothetical protein